jgi:hypothetical protein
LREFPVVAGVASVLNILKIGADVAEGADRIDFAAWFGEGQIF